MPLLQQPLPCALHYPLKGGNTPRQKANNPILALHRAFNQKQPGAANGMAMPVEDVRPRPGAFNQERVGAADGVAVAVKDGRPDDGLGWPGFTDWGKWTRMGRIYGLIVLKTTAGSYGAAIVHIPGAVTRRQESV